MYSGKGGAEATDLLSSIQGQTCNWQVFSAYFLCHKCREEEGASMGGERVVAVVGGEGGGATGA